MDKMNQCNHLVFFDSTCPFCRKSVQRIIQIDSRNIFCFAPLNGKTAEDFLKNGNEYLKHSNSLVLVENFFKEPKKFWIRSKGAFRILWLIGGVYKALAWMYLLPSFICDWAYNLIARHRHKLFKERELPEFKGSAKNRFLP